MSTTVNAYNSAASSAGAMQSVSQAPQALNTKSDAEVVAQVATTEIKPSSVNETSQPAREAVAKAAADLQEFVKSMGRNLNFSVDETTGYHVVKVVNPDTRKVVFFGPQSLGDRRAGKNIVRDLKKVGFNKNIKL